jgi:hypothetical protein
LLATQYEYTNPRMNHYLISFPSSAMSHISDEDFRSVVASSHAVIREAKAAGGYVFGGGIDETIPPILVTWEGKVSPGTFLRRASSTEASACSKHRPAQRPNSGQQRLPLGAGALRSFESLCMTQSHKCLRAANTTLGIAKTAFAVAAVKTE